MSAATPVHVQWPEGPPYDGARLVIERLAEAGHRAWIVGGAVRDLLRSAPAGDVDVATEATPDAVMRLWPCAVPTGLAHGTVSVPAQGQRYEVTTLRADGPYADARRPSSVRFTMDLKEDLARRDFTVNAMALTLDGRLSDPFGGREDLARGMIRAVGNPAARFAEDGLRVARAYRFAAILGFSLESGTALAAERFAPVLSRVSAERRREEWFRWLPCVTPPVCTALPQAVYGAWVNGRADVIFLCRLTTLLPADLYVRMAAVAGWEAACESPHAPWPEKRETASRWLSRLRVSRADTSHVLALLALAELWRGDAPACIPLTAAAAIKRVGRDRLWLAVGLAEAFEGRPVQEEEVRRRVDDWWARSIVHGPGELAADGRQVQEWTGVRGREVGLLLAYLYDLAALGHIANNPQALEGAARAWTARREAERL